MSQKKNVLPLVQLSPETNFILFNPRSANLWNNIFLSSLMYIVVLIRFSLSICSWYGKLVDLCSRKSNEVANIAWKTYRIA